MSVNVVVGGQYGSEGKAKAVIAIAEKAPGAVVGVRCGGVNAGHTVYINGNKYVLRTIPALAANPKASLVIAAGAMVDLGLLMNEMTDLETMGVQLKGRLFIDGGVAVVDKSYVEGEKTMGLGDLLGSTQTGTGITSSERILRRARLLKNVIMPKQVSDCVCDTGEALDNMIAGGQSVFLEGTQGFGLDLFHSGHYPYCTSRCTTAAGMVAEAGISPLKVTDVTMVLRTYPIRVGGNSGPMLKEITWEEIGYRCHAPEPLIEMTSVTKKVRRVGEFDTTLLKRACRANKPTALVVHGLDYLHWANRGVLEWKDITNGAKDWVRRLERVTGVPVAMAFTGPRQDQLVEVPR